MLPALARPGTARQRLEAAFGALCETADAHLGLLAWLFLAHGEVFHRRGPMPWVDVFAELGSGQAERQRHGNKSLLRTIVKIALDALALRIAGRDDPSAGGSYLLKLRVDFCGEARVVVAHPDRGRDGGNQAPVFEQGRIMHDCREVSVRAFDEDHGSPLVGW